MKKFKPDYKFAHFTEINKEWLVENEIELILSDLDGTLAAWNELGGEVFEKWLAELHAVNIELFIVSNNSQTRVDSFVNYYGINGIGQCKKPSKGAIFNVLKDKGINPFNVLFLGDQVFTDVMTGKKLGTKTAMVSPFVGEYEPFRTSCKRWLERIVL